jgi:hypothetical protein
MDNTPHIIDHVKLVKSFADARNDDFLSYLMEMALLHCAKMDQHKETQNQLSRVQAIGL